jgi:hypothetical protein
MFMSLLKGGAASCLLFSLSVLCGCRDMDPGPNNPVKPNLVETGVITGNVIVVNVQQERVGNKGGVVVTVDGSSVTCVSDYNGRYTLQGLAPGLYNITWSKADFGYSRYIGVRCNLEGVSAGPKVWVVEIPRFSVEGLRDSLWDRSVIMTGKAVGVLAGSTAAIRFFVGTTPDVSSDPSRHIFTCQGFSPIRDQLLGKTSSGSVSSSALQFALPLDQPNLGAAGVVSGATIYVVAYADGFPSQSYDDFQTGRRVFTTINPVPSNVVRVTLP